MGNNELYHWKYTRKYRKNGKWQYIYNDPAAEKRYLNSAKSAAVSERLRAKDALARGDKHAAEAHTRNAVEAEAETKQYQKWKTEQDKLADVNKAANDYTVAKVAAELSRDSDGRRAAGALKEGNVDRFKENITRYLNANKKALQAGEDYVEALMRQRNAN